MSESTCRSTRELLPWYLNRSLDEARRSEVERHLETCADCRRELEEVRWAYRLYTRHLPPAAVLAYVAGAGPRLDLGGGATLARATAEQHLAACAACRDDVAMARESLAAVEGGAGRGNVVPFAPRRLAVGHSTGARRLALAASLLLAVIAAGGWLTASQRASEHAGTVAELERRLEALEAAPPGTEPGTEPGTATGTEPQGAAEPGGDPLAGLATQVEALTAEADRLRAEVDEGKRRIATLQSRYDRPRLSTSVIPPSVVRGGEQDPPPAFPLGEDGASVVFDLRGVTGTQPARITGDRRVDLGTVEVPQPDVGLPVLTLHLPRGFLPPGDYVLELSETRRYPFRLVAAD